ncbi:MAG: hypothetical protein ACRC0V_11295 [Fusobacteriaceae bacterium]
MSFKEQLEKDNEKIFFNKKEFSEKILVDGVERTVVLSSNLSGDGTFKKGSGINEGVQIGIRANVVSDITNDKFEISDEDIEYYYSKSIGETIKIGNIPWIVKAKWKEFGVLFFKLEQNTGL